MLCVKLVNDKTVSYLPVKNLIAHKRTQFQEVIICDLDLYGKTLIMDDELQSCYIDKEVYHEALIHQFYKPKPKDKMLIIGAGEGVSIDIALRRGWKNIDAVDIDHQAIELINKHLSDWNNHIYKRQDEYNLIFDDALKVLKRTDSEYYDYVIFDLTSKAINENKDEWIAEIHRVLKHNGALSAQDGSKYYQSYLYDTVNSHFENAENTHLKTMLDWRYLHVAKK